MKLSPITFRIGLFVGSAKKGYVSDSACAFTKDLAKPISKECAILCAKAGSPLVIRAEDGTIYWPSGQNPKLLPFAGDKVIVSGKVYQRGGYRSAISDCDFSQAS